MDADKNNENEQEDCCGAVWLPRNAAFFCIIVTGQSL